MREESVAEQEQEDEDDIGIVSEQDINQQESNESEQRSDFRPNDLLPA